MRDLNTVCIILTSLFWIVVMLYWIVSAERLGKTHEGNEIFSFIKLIGSALVIYLPLLTGGFLADRLFKPSLISELTGTVFCASGLWVMIRARIHLGHNWSGNVILQQGHSLAMSGPYKYIRHPIYSGGLLAMLGTAIVLGQVFGFVWTLFCLFGLNIKMIREEKLLTEQFPEEYPTYRKQVKRMIPFIW